MKNSSAKTLQSSLRSANFILLVLGQGISLFGNTMLRFAMSMWVLDETFRPPHPRPPPPCWPYPSFRPYLLAHSEVLWPTE